MKDKYYEIIKELKLEALRCSEYRLSNTNVSVRFYFSPGNLTATSNRQPVICAFLKEGKELLDFSSAQLLIDDEEVNFNLDANSLTYYPKTPLSYGTHTGKIKINTLNQVVEEFNWSFIVEDELKNYCFSYGIPHSHTSYSDGVGTPTEAYEKARQNGLNFLVVTDHQGKLVSTKINHDKSIFISGSSHPKWEMLKLEASHINSKHKNFIALSGFELSTRFWGHINIINSQGIIEKRPASLDELYDWLCTEENLLLSINHPYRSPKTLPFSHNFDNFVNLYEVGNGSTTREYNRAEQNYYETLDSGWHIAAINGQDNHIDDWGDSSNVTAVISRELSVEALIAAIKLRRIYSTESKSLKLVVKGNNQWMGSIINLSKNDILHLHILAEDKNSPIDKIQIVSNGGKIIKEKLCGNLENCEWNLELSIDSSYSWYVAKVIHSDEKIAISSAIFVQDLQ
ncbi:CehA/McbA family metallohydrolase [Clostridium swellfunianum]|uniref:CehA/McbA family metallohydrolase n=1 Tax=Clostridium swellfunianum TaxID=1367462 RepID=UPI00202F9F4B|nr:CehA/McbA family metallohydrolase [Clostridium swellfunianum]MCM0647671.1 CehA/McbA family metallohydrolase [Clostridium swellfunianum]